MAKETELKLRFNPEQAEALALELNRLAEFKQQQLLKNYYFDTPNCDIAAAKAALRIRETAQGFEQTFKTRGISLAGLQQRGEWNWPLPSKDLALNLLSQVEQALPQPISALPLQEVFATHFQRRTWIWQQGATQVEIALDQGSVQAQGKTQPLCELELELLQGDRQALWQLASVLCQHCVLWLSDVSKAERGYLLAGLSSPWQPSSSLSLSALLLHLQRAVELAWDNPATAQTPINTALAAIAKQESPLVNALAAWFEPLPADILSNLILANSLLSGAYLVYQLATQTDS